MVNLFMLHQQDTLYVNLFIPSQLNWKEQGVTLTQETLFPDDEKVTLRIDKAAKKNLTLMIRIPEWAGNSKGYEITINGKKHLSDIQTGASTYLPIRRKWKKGDMITFHLPMKVSLEQIPDKKDYYAFLYGPIVLATSTGTENLDGIYADDAAAVTLPTVGKHLCGDPEADRESRFYPPFSSQTERKQTSF